MSPSTSQTSRSPLSQLLAPLLGASLALGSLCAPHQQVTAAPRAEMMTSSDFPFKIKLGGYTQVRYQRIQDDPNVAQFIGLNDGFALSNARLNLELKRGRISTFLSLEGARERREPNNRAQGDVRTLMLDAYLDYSLIKKKGLTLRFGRFKPAYDANELESTQALMFIDRALESRGVLGVEGINEAGLSLSRQVGVQALSELSLGKDTTLHMILSLTNGNSAEQAVNDNESLAYTGRLVVEHDFSSDVSVAVGGGAYLNERSTGELPDLIAEERLGVTADVALTLQRLRLQGQWMRQDTTFTDVPQEPQRVGEGFHASVGLDLGFLHPHLTGMMPSYRFATYDPTKQVDSADETLNVALGSDAITHHTIGLTAELSKSPLAQPLKVQINYTLAQEEEARASNNDRLDVMIQVVF